MSTEITVTRDDDRTANVEALREQTARRWAEARDWFLDQDACTIARLDDVLTGARAKFRGAVGFDDRLADVVQHLAALALDQVLFGGEEASGA